MYQISVSEVLERAWEQFKKHGLVLTVIFLVIQLVVTAIGEMCGPDVDETALLEAIQAQDWQRVQELNANPLGNILQSLLYGILMLGFINSLLLLLRGKATSVSFDMWKLPLVTYVKVLASNVILSIVVIIGLCLCIIPGIWLAARLQFAEYLLIENPDCGVIDSLKESWKMSKGNSMNLILLFIAQFFIGVIGVILCCIGLFPAGVLIYAASVVAYLTLCGFYSEPIEVEE